MAAMLPKLFFVHFRDTSFVAEDDGALAGFLCGFRSQTFPDEAYIHFVGVDPAHARLGSRPHALRALLRRGRAANDRARGHVAGQRALGRLPPGARLRDRSDRSRLRRRRRAARAARQAAAVTRSRDTGSRAAIRRWRGGCTGLPGAVRRTAGRAAALARRLRATPGRGRGARQAWTRRRGSLADRSRPGEARRPTPARRQGPPARSRRRVGARPLLVARPDGAHVPPARRAHDAHLARLVRDVERRGRQPGADAQAERPLPLPRGRLVPPAPARRDERPGDAQVAERDRERQGIARTRTTGAR